jgi:PAS domain S-box-containing protein
VGSRRPTFPSEFERALIGIGSSQLTFALRERASFEHTLVASALREADERVSRRRAEESLRQSEQRFRSAFDAAPIGMALVGLDGRFLQVNRALCEQLGYREDELLALTFQATTHPGDLEANLEFRRRLIAREIDRYTMEKRYVHKQGHVVWTLLYVSLVRTESGEPLHFISQIKDMTEAKRAERERERLLAEVTTARERLQVLSRRLVSLQEEERRTIARELHDEVGQILTGLKLMLETSERPGATVDVGQLKEVTGQLLERVQDLSLNLRPPMLDDLGLVPTLLWHFERYRAQTGIEVRFHHREALGRWAADTEITAFRIIQEALTNVARHAGVQEVRVELWTEAGRLRLRVEDEGRGFNPAALEPTSGLTGMRERVLLAGGGLYLDSQPGAGTRLSAELPLEARAARRAS